MVQHSSGLDCQIDAISADILVSMRPSNAVLVPTRDASCGRPASLTQHHRNVAPPVEAPQPNLAAGHEAEEEDERGVLGRQRALGLHAPAEFLVQPLNDIRGAQRLPLPLWELKERE